VLLAVWGVVAFGSHWGLWADVVCRSGVGGG
jgi:hypothetical protein